ncbi:hypothetical protein Xmau_03106 [Xenorhabdus mauleonii]|uniref:Uncharacterized protein n=1 Tax=Xenorhabdus mauleonii TaxID=351675 RepID=A0A1I3SIM8_9GAMM|nr:hypothetical protein [Xenorhabdus mauleonii]PHM39199.1 hypothetical protein Xmau_03106 [Xenorhabdus mauleonii]SFJ58545.1 hypothetical protein SAMN05421680_111127 [Xenorhabdus mauleonii]
MSLGIWGTELLKRNFDEAYYLGDHQAFMQWCILNQYDPDDTLSNEKFKNISSVDLGNIRRSISMLYTGNCGALADYFLSHSVTRTPVGNDLVEHILQTFDFNQSGLFRITIGNASNGNASEGNIHTFIGILKANNDQEIEILQAWNNKYSVTDWLKKKQNVFSISEFVNNLKNLSSLDSFEEASNALFSTLEKKNLLERQAYVTKFAFKALDSAKMNSILHGELNRFNLNAPHSRVANIDLERR